MPPPTQEQLTDLHERVKQARTALDEILRDSYHFFLQRSGIPDEALTAYGSIDRLESRLWGQFPASPSVRRHVARRTTR